MHRLLMICLLFALMFITAGTAFAAVYVSKGQVTTAVVDRRPGDTVVVYPAYDGEIYCFTRIVDADNDTTVTHNWYLDGDLVSTTTLAVKSSYWRTFSSKTISEDMQGKWRVDVADEEGLILKSYYFPLQ